MNIVYRPTPPPFLLKKWRWSSQMGELILTKINSPIFLGVILTNSLTLNNDIYQVFTVKTMSLTLPHRHFF